METRFCNFFKTKNAMALMTKAILESPYNFFLIIQKTSTLKAAVHFSTAVQFLATFKRLNCYNFGIVLTKSIMLHFLRSLP